jgi:hypothetical protein
MNTSNAPPRVSQSAKAIRKDTQNPPNMVRGRQGA